MIRNVVLGMGLVAVLAACGVDPTPIVPYTPPKPTAARSAACGLPIHHHSPEFNDQAYEELHSLPAGSAMSIVVAEHIALQDAIENECDVSQGRKPRHAGLKK